MLALMQHEIIKINQWITASEFIDLVALAEMTPGPIAINLATFVGYKVAGPGGAILATFGVIVPSLLLALPVAKLFTRYGQHPLLEHILSDVQPAVIALISLAALLLGKEVLLDLTALAIAIGSFLLLRFSRVHPFLIIGLGALVGLIIYG